MQATRLFHIHLHLACIADSGIANVAVAAAAAAAAVECSMFAAAIQFTLYAQQADGSPLLGGAGAFAWGDCRCADVNQCSEQDLACPGRLLRKL